MIVIAFIYHYYGVKQFLISLLARSLILHIFYDALWQEFYHMQNNIRIVLFIAIMYEKSDTL